MSREPESFKLTSKIAIPRLARQAWSLRNWRADAFEAIAQTFGNPAALAASYVDPVCRANAEAHPQALSRRLRAFLNGAPKEAPHNQLLLTGNAGTGKSAALAILKIASLSMFWPQGYRCTLLKLGPDAVETIKRLPHAQATLLLLDGLDEDPEAWHRGADRLNDLLRETRFFRRVVVACDADFLTASTAPPCPTLRIEPLDDRRFHHCLRRRFPKRLRDRLLLRLHPTADRLGRLLAQVAPQARLILANHTAALHEAPPREETSALHFLAEAWLGSEARRLGKILPEPPLPKELREACGALATQLFRGGSPGLREAEVANMAMHQPALGLIPALASGFQSLIARDADGRFRFAHYRFQRLFAEMAAAYDPEMAKLLVGIFPRIANGPSAR